ncbi:MAG: ribosomal protein S18-alanine N-acetyltransferase [Archaeoglobaceae archaeon]|nr:ribosomal protein S18-alanine N-acetyltransferase [Archaeoglobaceae archaeon]
MISVVIREYCVRDFRDVLEIDAEAFNSRNPAYDVYIYLAYSSNFLVADIGGKAVGYIVTMDMGVDSKIMSFAVKKEFRGKGIGSMLLKEVIKRCKNKGKHRILLEVRVSNVVAQKLYKKNGFKTIEILPKYYNDGEDAYLMELRLVDNF